MFYITTSRPYTNSNPHLGTMIDAIYGDTYSRFFKRVGEGLTYFSMGTDEHSFKIVDKAKELSTTPKEFVDKKYKEFKSAFENLDILSDNFIQSSEPKHHWLANLVWEKLKAKGLIYKKNYHGLYCTGCEDFYSESQLIDGHCPIHSNLQIQKVDEENYFYKLSSFKEQILDYLGKVKVPDKSVILEMQNFTEKLEDISISRDRSRLSMDWGIPVWSDPKSLMYVWFEALLTYLTPLLDDDLYEQWQEGDNDIKAQIEGEVWETLKEKLPQNLQIIGRDNSKFHLIIYSAILFGLDLPAIETVIIHGMINDHLGRKFAKSLGNGVELVDFLAKVGKEGVRFFILHDVNSVGDTNFHWGRAIESHNSNLADNLGNLLIRITNLIDKNLDGKIDLLETNIDQDLVNLSEVYTSLKAFNSQTALQKIFSQTAKINQYLEETKPWQLVKDFENGESRNKFVEILTKSALALLKIAEALSIFLPETGSQIAESLTAEKITKAKVLFPKLELNSEV